jgi:TatA/E family protein of Tat protein translocase
MIARPGSRSPGAHRSDGNRRRGADPQEAVAAMFGSIGGPELLVIFVIALLIFGPKKLTELGRTLGKGVAEFRKAASDLRDTLDAEVTRSEASAPKGRTLTDGGKEPGPAAATDAETRDERA